MLRVISQVAVQQLAFLRAAPLGLSVLEQPPPALGTHARLSAPRFLRLSAVAASARSPEPSPEGQVKPDQNRAGSLPRGDAASQAPQGVTEEELAEVDPLHDKSIGLFQRFKKTFKQYGKVMVPVHLATSSLWFGTFYYGAMHGVNVVPFLEFIGLPDKVLNVLRDSQSGYALTAYAMYKIATPARYTVTLGGTSISVKYLRKHGYLSTPPPVKDYLQDKMEETRERLSEKMEETKERFSEKMEETKERFSEKMETTKERFSEKMEETKERFSEKMEETKEKFSERMEETKELFGERKGRLSEKMDDTRETFSDKLQETKDKVSVRKKSD